MGKSCIEEIASLTVRNASWVVGGSRGICNEEIILTVHWHWFKLSWLLLHRLSVNSQIQVQFMYNVCTLNSMVYIKISLHSCICKYSLNSRVTYNETKTTQNHSSIQNWPLNYLLKRNISARSHWYFLSCS